MAVTAVLLLGMAWGVAAQGATECVSRSFGYDSVVCVCNATYCDQPGTISAPAAGSFTTVTSSRDGLRFSTQTLAADSQQTPDAVVITVEASQTHQSMLGFGGAFTDSTGLNVVTLSSQAQDNLLRSYFSPEGISYSLCRIPIAGSDFSVRPYSYDDVEGDVDLQFFELQYEDYDYKLPLILQAQQLSPTPIKLFGSPWSPPAWMKTNGKFNESGELLPEMWQPWANYFVKFVEAYEAAGAPMWGLTTQNEPLSGFDETWAWNTCGWTAEDMRDWIKGNLGPTLAAAGMRRLVVMVDDYNRDTLPWYVQPMLEDPEAAQYIDGTAVHWYKDDLVGPVVLDETQALHPDKFLLYTEACTGSHVPESVQLGSWERAQMYAHNIIEGVNHFSRGWVDWNMALDMEGGPNWADNYVDSPIIINAAADEFYKQPMFYALGHFSKFVDEGMVQAEVVSSDPRVEVAAFLPQSSGAAVLVVLNTEELAKKVSVSAAPGSFLNFQIPAKAVQTVLFYQ